MKRIALCICAVVVLTFNLPETGYGQVPREVPGPALSGSLGPPPDDRLRIPDSFFRHQNMPNPQLRGEMTSFSEIRRKIEENYPDSKIVDVRMLVPRREGLDYLIDVKVLTKEGKLLSVKLNAKSAEIVDVRG